VKLSSARFSAAVFAAAAAARLAFLVIWKAKHLEAVLPPDSYANIALYWLGRGPLEVSITHPPLYSAFLAALFWLSGPARGWTVPVLQCLISAACAPLLYVWAKKLGSETAARVAAVWLAVDPGLIFFAPQLQSETLFIFLSLGFFVLLYAALELKKEEASRGFAVGVAGAVASLCRGVMMAYSPFLALALVRMGRWRFLAFLIAGWVLPVMMWTVRNYRYYGEIIPISVQSGWNMYEGFTLDREELKRRPYDMGEEARATGNGDALAADKYFKKKINAWIRGHRREAAKIVVFKMFRFWRPWPYDPYTGLARVVIGIYFTALLGFAACGAWLSRASALRLLPVYGLFIALTILHSIYFTSLRYRLPLEPYLCFFAATGLARAWSALKRRA
jgi:4-amino-4-deoxy-L-arabinose transferase-like glycosyltransferase